MKKVISLVLAGLLTIGALSACTSKPSSSDTPEPSKSEESRAVRADMFDTVKSALSLGDDFTAIGDDYMAWLGFKEGDCDSYAGAFRNGSVDVILLVDPRDGKEADVKAVLQKQLDSLIGANENYPGIPKDKVDAGKVMELKNGIIGLLIYGDDSVVEADGADAAIQPLIDLLTK